MNFKTKSSNITKVLYIVLVLCIISVMLLSIYSIFNPKANPNDNVLLNDETNPDSEDALFEFFRKSTTEPPTQPATEPKTQAPTQPQTAAPKPPKSNEIPSAVNDSEDIPDNQNQIPTTDKPADAVIDRPETAIEVISVPTIFLKPVSGHMSRSHNPDMPEYSVAMNDYRTHMGIDIDSEIGVNVKAVSDGVISEIYDDPLMGKTVVIDHPENIQSIYMNLQELLPKNITVGVEVKGGDVIGGVGDTALIEMYDVPHLHFEMKKDGSYTDPLEYIQY